MLPRDPGSFIVALWSFCLPSKRRINLYTLCKRCIDDEGWYASEEQLMVICKKRDQFFYCESLPWVKQQWNFWLSCSEVQRINDAAAQDGSIIFNLCVGAAMA
jgi:hypothetical protein